MSSQPYACVLERGTGRGRPLWKGGGSSDRGQFTMHDLTAISYWKVAVENGYSVSSSRLPSVKGQAPRQRALTGYCNSCVLGVQGLQTTPLLKILLSLATRLLQAHAA